MENSTTNLQSVDFNSANSKKKQAFIFFILMLIFFISIFGLYIFLFLKKNNTSSKITRPDTEFFEINPANSEINKITKNPQAIVITDLDFSNGEFRPIGRILRGYFESYNDTSHTLKLKNQVVNNSVLQLIETNTSKINNFYCWPLTFPGKDGPVDIKTIQVSTSTADKNIYVPGEKIVPLDQLDTFTKENQYIILQLEKEFNLEKTNFIKKLVLVGC